MADAGADISQLTEEQQAALQQFTSVTDQDHETAIPLLQRCQWNVQIAIARFFDGEPVAPIEDSTPAPRDERRSETLMNGFSSPRTSTSVRDRYLEPAPRVVPQPDSQVSQQASLLLSLVLTPFNILYSLSSRIAGFVGWLFPFLPRLLSNFTGSTRTNTAARRTDTSGRRPLNTKDTAARFIREFEEQYGTREGSPRLPFYEDGYARGYDEAKRDLKFLLVVLLSPEHDDTASFAHDTLLSPEFAEWLNNKRRDVILWAGSVQDSEAYQVSSALNVTKFPFVGLIVHTPSVSSTSMSTIARVAGPTSPSTLISKLNRAMTEREADLSRIRAQRAEQQATRRMREEQDSAFERSLATDRERARRKKEEAEAEAKAEKDALQKQEEAEREAQNLEQWRRWRASKIAPEPLAAEKDVVRISLRLLDGERVVRRFASNTEVEELYAFVECYDILRSQEEQGSEKLEKPDGWQHEYKFQLVSPMPREAFEVAKGGTIRERMGRSGNLIVEKIGDDEDEEADE